MAPSLLPTNVANVTNTASVPLVGALAVIAHSDVGNVSGVSGVSDAARSDRWPLIVALLLSPTRESRRLAALLTGWPHVARKHELADDCRRRQWRRA